MTTPTDSSTNSDANLPRPDNFDDQPKYSYGCFPSTPNPADKFVKFSSVHVNNYMDEIGLQYNAANMPPSFNVLTT